MLESQAINRYIGSSPRKMRLIIDLIRGKSVDEALTLLHFSTKHASKVAEKVVRSAVSNIHSMEGGERIEPDQIYIKEAYVNGGPTAKRMMPAPMGRAYRIRKRSNHLTIIIAEKVSRTKAKAPPREPAKEPVKT